MQERRKYKFQKQPQTTRRQVGQERPKRVIFAFLLAVSFLRLDPPANCQQQRMLFHPGRGRQAWPTGSVAPSHNLTLTQYGETSNE